MAYARSVRYLGSQRTGLASQVGLFLLAPVYGLLYLTILMPIRVWALFSLRNPGWGTRRHVEVRFQHADRVLEQDEGQDASPLAALTDLDGFTTAAAVHTEQRAERAAGGGR